MHRPVMTLDFIGSAIISQEGRDGTGQVAIPAHYKAMAGHT